MKFYGSCVFELYWMMLDQFCLEIHLQTASNSYKQIWSCLKDVLRCVERNPVIEILPFHRPLDLHIQMQWVVPQCLNVSCNVFNMFFSQSFRQQTAATWTKPFVFIQTNHTLGFVLKKNPSRSLGSILQNIVCQMIVDNAMEGFDWNQKAKFCRFESNDSISLHWIIFQNHVHIYSIYVLWSIYDYTVIATYDLGVSQSKYIAKEEEQTGKPFIWPASLAYPNTFWKNRSSG